MNDFSYIFKESRFLLTYLVILCAICNLKIESENKEDNLLIPGQCFHLTPPENTRKNLVFCYKPLVVWCF